MRIKKLKEQVKNLIQQVIGSCILAFTKNKKENKELEKENARLTTNEKSLLAERKIIVKENAELKEKIEVLECDNYNANCNLNLITDQLTKAKDHIKKLLDYLKQDTNDPQTNYYVCQYMDKAEQFLKEIEK